MVFLLRDGELCHYVLGNGKLENRFSIPKCKYFSSSDTGFAFIKNQELFMYSNTGMLVKIHKIKNPLSLHSINQSTAMLVYSTKILIATNSGISKIIEDYFGDVVVHTEGSSHFVVDKKKCYSIMGSEIMKVKNPKCDIINIDCEPSTHIRDNLYDCNGFLCIKIGKFLRKTGVPSKNLYVIGLGKIRNHQQYFCLDYGLTKIICDGTKKVLVDQSFELAHLK